MARRKSKKQTKKLIGIIIAIILAFLAYEAKDLSTTSVNPDEFAKDDAVYVHFIDVGQGSATLIQQGKKGVIIDAGEKDYGETVVNYIESVGVEEIALAVASHPHSDHIGGLDEVLYAYSASEIVLPELTESNTPTTRVYEDLLIAIDDRDIPARFIFDDTFYCNMTNDVEVIVTAPTEQSDNLNDMSLLCYINCFDTTFFVPGDAENGELRSVYNESDIYDLGADVMAMAHHGSSTSIYEPYLDAVNADVAVISCGKDNSYGHPHDEAMDYITENNMTSLRTDEMGDIVFKVTEEGYSLVN
ncbi:MAG: MBL fold metallo-hydrolase [Clostridia bacterium]|nr:MBL fold metallo-hydrolase [Clostridia bacterium]